MEQFQLNPKQKELLVGQVEEAAAAVEDLKLEEGKEKGALKDLERIKRKLEKLKKSSDPEILKYNLVLRDELAKKLGLSYVGPFKDGWAAADRRNEESNIGGNFVNEIGNFMFEEFTFPQGDFSEGVGIYFNSNRHNIYINTKGQALAEKWGEGEFQFPDYFKVKAFSHGFGRVSKGIDQKYEFLFNKNGEELLQKQKLAAVFNDFSDGFIVAEMAGTNRYVYLNEEGKIHNFPKAFDAMQFVEAKPFKNGMAWVAYEDANNPVTKKKWILINKEGEKLMKKGGSPVNKAYARVEEFSDGVAWVSPVIIGKRWDLIDGERVLCSRRYEEVRPFHEGLAAVKDGKGWFYINKQGHEVFPGKRFNMANDFHEGLAEVLTINRFNYAYWNFIDKEGNVFDYAGDGFQAVEPFRNGIASVWLDGKGYLINKKGEFLFNRQEFEEVNEGWQDGFRIVKSNGCSFFISKDGQKCFEEKGFSQVNPFSNGVAHVLKDGVWFYIDIHGERIFN